jgi:hypothetical protein
MKVVHVNVNFVREINLLSLLLEACAPSKIIPSRSSISRFSSFFDFDQKIQFCADYLRISFVLLLLFAPAPIIICSSFGIPQYILKYQTTPLSLSLFSTLRPYLSSPE